MENLIIQENQWTEKERMRALEMLRTEQSEENLWNCIIAFQGYPFHTFSGLPFTYRLKVGRSGEYTKELFIDRRENSKSLSFSSIRLAFEKAVEKKELMQKRSGDADDSPVFDRPKALGDIRGVSYSYSLLWRFGVIEVPKEIAEKLG